MKQTPAADGKDGPKGAAETGGRRRSESGEAVRQKVKALATEMFIRHGYNGVTFLDLSKALGINHSLIHYHFGTKSRLAEEVLQDFSESGIRENKAIWEDPNASLFDKFVAARDRMYRRFRLFNPTGRMQHPTGLVSRFSMDAESLTPKLRDMVRATQEKLDACIEEAVRIAIARRELVAETPVQLVHRVAASLEALPAIVDAVGDRSEVYLDGGVRRGSDVITALALGAKAVLIGRAYSYGLAANGERGAAHVLSILREDIRRTLILMGCPGVSALDRNWLLPAP